jgi:hypothetical protein
LRQQTGAYVEESAKAGRRGVTPKLSEPLRRHADSLRVTLFLSVDPV